MTPELLNELEALVPLAPLHEPHNLAPIRMVLTINPELPQVACFDTAFHRTAPEVAQAFALPYALYEEGVQALRLSRAVLRIHRLRAAAARPRDRRRPGRRRASRQWLLGLRDAGGPFGGDDDGVHRARRAADGHPRVARSTPAWFST